MNKVLFFSVYYTTLNLVINVLVFRIYLYSLPKMLDKFIN